MSEQFISKMNGLEMSPDEFKRFLVATIPQGHPTLVVGAPGVGKTDVVTEATREIEYDLKVIHPVVADPTDVKGMPFVSNGEAQWLPFGDLKDLIEADRPTVAFLDDLGQASPMVQASYMQLLLFRSINEHKVSDHVTFVAATNRKQDKAGVSGILEPVKSRFASIIHLVVNYRDWLKWAYANDISEELIGYVNFKPTCLDPQKPDPEIINHVCPRTLANLDKLIKLQLPRDIERKAYAGAIGPAETVGFMGFLSVFGDIPDPDEALRNPMGVSIPAEDRADARWALASAVSIRAEKDNFKNMLALTDRMGVEYGTMAVAGATTRDPKLKSTAAFTEWATKHAAELNA
jgi:hypothetical protein